MASDTGRGAADGGLFLPAAAGVEGLLADEVTALLPAGLAGVRPRRGGVEVQAAQEAHLPALAMRLNLHSRLAQRVLWRVAQARYGHEQDLYELARRVDWTAWIDARGTLKVDVTAQRSPLHSLHFAGLRIKDAVCDVLRERQGARPDVDTRRPDLPLLLHVDAEWATLYVDTSGEALFKRGWREDRGEAPLKETLAAALLAAAGWQGRPTDGPLLDPCCGAGTIAIEAAQLACGIAPGGQRRFAFERQAPFREAARRAEWQALKDEARAAEHPPAAPVFAGDVSFRMTDFAQRNAERAGVARAIEFKTVDALQRPPPAPQGTLVLNPPYGERLAPKGQGAAPDARRGGGGGREAFAAEADGPAASADEAAAFFGALATHWKRHYAGWTAWVLSPEPALPSWMRLKESRRVPLWNGPIECRLMRFELVAGRLGRERGDAAAAAPDA
ncbi:class I SAM-dependent RNA methyltransferase [Aquabacterium sp. J223]|uniref:THUMP domain-containing class I SAM-dependent RNA methyltransferase n=1 Tax=Aquabacterium sp. J223 TaxID=2898431 RepID=UPI0021ADED4D|nr:THUMP domain-containing protein [Aquabacterium sp. J223]UUX95861.1 THUMP domain-containing protein [Aquabacterium sp. J223]